MQDLRRDIQPGPDAMSRLPTNDAARTVADMMAAIRDMAPAISMRSAEFEALRHIPRDVIDDLRSVGLFRLFAPREFGGLEIDLPRGLPIMSMLSRIDGSLGWIATTASGSAIAMPCVQRQLLERIYQDGPDVIAAGSLQPAGTAEAVPGGYRVNGRWPFTSGCQHADWMFVLCVMTKDGKPIPGPQGPGGPPLTRGVVLPAREFEIEDTWFATGLKGTGSHHITLKGTLVASEHLCEFPDGPIAVDGPLYQAVKHVLPMLHGAFSVGVARGALDDLLAMAASGRQQQRAATPMRASETFQFELGRAAADILAAEATAQGLAATMWSHALAGTLKTETRLAEITAIGGWLATTCTRAADLCFTLGGGSAVYESSPLQRRMRDVHAGAQHATIHQRNWAQMGRMLLADVA